MVASPADRIRLEGSDPTNWASGGVRKLVRRYVEEMDRLRSGFVVLLPDPEYPFDKPRDRLFASVAQGRPVAALRVTDAGRVQLLAVAHPSYEPRVRDCLGGRARLEAVGIEGDEHGADSLVAFAMNVYDEFGINVTFAPTAVEG